MTLRKKKSCFAALSNRFYGAAHSFHWAEVFWEHYSSQADPKMPLAELFLMSHKRISPSVTAFIAMSGRQFSGAF